MVERERRARVVPGRGALRGGGRHLAVDGARPRDRLRGGAPVPPACRRARSSRTARRSSARGGRPHWGKMHSLDAERLGDRYERFDDFLALRKEIDPDRRFTNPYLERVLGD